MNDQQNVKFEELTITHDGGSGLYLRGSEKTNVDVLKCAVKGCKWTGMYVTDGAIRLQQHNVNLWGMVAP